jgi:hypothetical protein
MGCSHSCDFVSLKQCGRDFSHLNTSFDTPVKPTTLGCVGFVLTDNNTTYHSPAPLLRPYRVFVCVFVCVLTSSSQKDGLGQFLPCAQCMALAPGSTAGAMLTFVMDVFVLRPAIAATWSLCSATHIGHFSIIKLEGWSSFPGRRHQVSTSCLACAIVPHTTSS